MKTKLIKIGDKKYINPKYIVAILERSPNIWIARTRGGYEYVLEKGYFDDLIRELT